VQLHLFLNSQGLYSSQIISVNSKESETSISLNYSLFTFFKLSLLKKKKLFIVHFLSPFNMNTYTSYPTGAVNTNIIGGYGARHLIEK